jgi:carboxyl-terminal processing protease
LQNLDFSLFWQIWDTLNTSYYDKSKLIPSNMVYGAIKGMVQALGDPYTMFLPPSENKISQEDLQGNFEGVGIQIGFKGTQLAVMAPLPGSPADKAGIKAGDLIVGIKDEVKKIDRSTSSISLAEAVSIIRGPAGSKVTLALTRQGTDNPIIVDLKREVINVPSVSVDFKDDVAVIRLLKFGGDTESEWRKAVDQIKAKNVNKVVLDLRNDPGGYLQAAVDIAGDFLKKNSVVAIEEKGNGARDEFRTILDSGAFVNSKVVVLVNGGSASASEILAGALRDDRRIQLVGDKTFGKGTIQEPQDLEGGAGLHITIAKWLTPNGVWVHDKGLDPDVKVKDDDKTTDDEQLLEALKLVK